jgi:hypothetical protein
MLKDDQSRIILTTICVGILIAIAFYSSYSGMDPSQWPPRNLKSSESGQSQQDSTFLNHQAKNEKRVTESATVERDDLRAAEDQPESYRDKKERLRKASIDRWTIGIGVFTALIFLLQTGVFGRQAFRLRQTVKAMDSQSEDMKRYIHEATRAADAMEKVSGSLKINADMIVETVFINKSIALRQREFGIIQMRAYVSVLIGGGSLQNRSTRWKFEARPTLKNTGNSPAYKVRYKIAAAVLPYPWPSDFKFKLPKSWGGGSLIAPHTPVHATAVVEDFIDDETAERVRGGGGPFLYVWGMVSYKDLFNITRRVTFAQRIFFPGEKGNETVKGYYLEKHNTAN